MPTSDDPDGVWIQGAQDGDTQAYSELVWRWQDGVFRYLIRMLGSHDDALEAAQDAFLKAWQALPQWPPEARFGLGRSGSPPMRRPTAAM